jgi:hypothetical protein
MTAAPEHDVSGEAERAQLIDRVVSLIDRLADGSRDDAARDALIADVLQWQRANVETYARICGANADDAAVPTDVFRFARVAAHAPCEDTRVFRTSGTTANTRGAHHLRELALYDRAAHAAGRYALFPDVRRMRLAVLAPDEHEATDSSLSYMLARFVEWFGTDTSRYVWREGKIDFDALLESVVLAQREQEPLALLGTSLAFAHAEEALGAKRFALPRGSRIMQTGGFKGQQRNVDEEGLRRALHARYGIDDAWIVQEYGMTELSSQMYESTLRDAACGGAVGPRRLWVPGWLRASIVEPEQLQPVPAGGEGILRIDDLANVDTACAIQTSDRARQVDDGLRLLGRVAGATPRGCSIAVDAVLSGNGG